MSTTLFRTTTRLPSLRTTHPLRLTLMSTSSPPSRFNSTSTSPPPPPSTSDQLVLVDRQGPVTVLTLNRPKALNALSSPLFEQLNAELEKAEEDGEVKCIVLTGGEKVFAGKPPS